VARKVVRSRPFGQKEKVLKKFILASFVVLLSQIGLAENVRPQWEAVCTTDTDVVFSVQLPKDSYEGEERADFPLRIWHPDGQVEDYQVTLWRDGRGLFKRVDEVTDQAEPQDIPPDSPLGKVHLRVFQPEEFKEWDESLEYIGPRHEDLYYPENR
jgi:hypothetical protein